MHRQLIEEFLKALPEEGLTQAEFAKQCGVAASTISRFVAGARPETALLQAILTKWTNPEIRRRLVLANLRDNLALTPDAKLEDFVRTEAPNPLDGLLTTLRQRAAANPGVEMTLQGLVRATTP